MVANVAGLSAVIEDYFYILRTRSSTGGIFMGTKKCRKRQKKKHIDDAPEYKLRFLEKSATLLNKSTKPGVILRSH